MGETLEQRKSSMRKVIQHVLDEKPFEELTFEEKRIIKECADKKLIEGIVYEEMISGRIIAEHQHKPRLTLEGVHFMDAVDKTAATESPSGQSGYICKERPANDREEEDGAVNKVFQIVQPVIKKIWWLFCALGVFVTVFGWPLIIRFLTWLLSSLFRFFQ